MFDKFGEFDSAEEMNKAAAGLLEKGDTEQIEELAKENGIDKEDAQDYIDGIATEFSTPIMAAVGKLAVESRELSLEGILKEWKEYAEEMCTEDEELCRAVRRKGKSLKKCMAVLIKFAFENKVRVSDRIVEETKIMHNGKLEQMRKPLYLGIPNRTEARKLIRDYYTK